MRVYVSFDCRAAVPSEQQVMQDTKSKHPLTFHGLRHTFAAEKYLQLMDEGLDDLDARYAVSRLLGHNRSDVTTVYLAALKNNS